jgi:hypothetical protein
MEKTLTIAPAAWSDEAARYLASTFRGAPCFTVDDYRRELETNPDCRLYRVSEGPKLVGFVVLRLERFAGGVEGVIVAGAGRLVGAELFGVVVPALERMFSGVKSFRVEACRSGSVRELLKLGYLPTHFVMRKPASTPAPRPIDDDALEALAACMVETRGGGDVRSRPGKLHGGGGGKSTSSTQYTTTNVDRRLVVDSGSIGLSAESGTYNIQVLDQGAVDKAIELVKSSDQNTRETASELLGFTKDIFTAGLTVLDKAGSQVEKQTELVSKAYDAARGEGTQKNLVAAAALAAVAIVAVKVWGR